MIVLEFYLFFYDILCRPSNYSGQLIFDKTKNQIKTKKVFFTIMLIPSCITAHVYMDSDDGDVWNVVNKIGNNWSSGVVAYFCFRRVIFYHSIPLPCSPLCFSFSSSHQWWSYLKVRTNLDAFAGPPVSLHLWIFVLMRPKSKIQVTTDELCGVRIFVFAAFLPFDL